MEKKPNIVLIITDHHAYIHHERSEYPLAMPALSDFAARGVRFNRAYSVCPLCSPARASIMTGVYPNVHGMKWNCDGHMPGGLEDLRSGQLLYSHYLSTAGYRNAYIGKWHCGHSKIPADFGFEGWSLPDYGNVYRSPEYLAYAAERSLGEASARIEHNPTLPEREGEVIRLSQPGPWQLIDSSGVLLNPPEAHECYFVAHLVKNKLEELSQSSQPFSLTASFWSPHQPYFPADPFAGMIDPDDIPEYPTFRDDLRSRPLRHHMHRDLHQPSSQRWPEWSTWQKIYTRCYGQILQLDSAIRQILDHLDDLGLAENTLVIVCSDHGDALGSHGGLWDKSATFIEEVARVHLAVRWPGIVPAGMQVDSLVSNMDVTATILEAAGIPVPRHMNSRGLLPLCKDPGADWPDYLVCEHYGHGEAILSRIILRGDCKYVAALYDGDELYDLKQDPYETNNLLDEPAYSQIRGELRGMLIDHMKRGGDRAARRLLYALEKGF